MKEGALPSPCMDSPLLRNPHLLTIAGSLWRRSLDEARFPVREWLLDTEEGVRVLVHSQTPGPRPKGSVILVHGLEGSSQAGYMRSMAQALLDGGYAVHRLNIRSCGGTERHSRTLYHAGLTTDLNALAGAVAEESSAPLFAVGFSLGGNMVLKWAGESGETGPGRVAGVCAISTPLDLKACSVQLSQRSNRLYEWRFVAHMRRRLRRMPGWAERSPLHRVRTVYDFDDQVTAPAFGFRGADHYYETQSAIHFLEHIQVPALLVQAKDDPMIPFSVFDHPAVLGNPNLRLLAVERGGHLGFLSSSGPRFWVDGVVFQWLEETREQVPDGMRTSS
jgi:uncharacterized protein